MSAPAGRTRLARLLASGLWLGLVALGAACGDDDGKPSADEAPFLPCEGKCDSAGPLSVSSTWVPEGGFVRATLAGDYELRVDPPAGAVLDAAGNGRHIVRFESAGLISASSVAEFSGWPRRIAPRKDAAGGGDSPVLSGCRAGTQPSS